MHVPFGCETWYHTVFGLHFDNTKILKLILCIGDHSFGLLAWFTAFNFHFISCHNFRSVYVLSKI
jgi:hypothetical protein